ncbi:Alpha/Beta hydrolase protein [Lactifluus volemus]|nr:Alpha/Beta hydrolase protein [Lactifluus volemus]
MPMVLAKLDIALPTVTLDNGAFIGTTSDGINKFLGIPFAQPPVGDLRFRLPRGLGPYTGMHNASTFGHPCPQQAFPAINSLTTFPKQTADFLLKFNLSATTPDSEDCMEIVHLRLITNDTHHTHHDAGLTLNVFAPAVAEPGANLPVVAWIYGGGFEVGTTENPNATEIVLRSIELGEPIIYASMNYRVSAFGFLASKEVKDAGVGNLGLHDQRMALSWIQKYIGAFGGDPTKVTITGDITQGQPYYDDVVNRTGCSGSSDTLSCLRTVPYVTLKAAVGDSPSIFSYQSVALAWQPRVDGVFLTHSPQKLVLDGKVADIPFVTGDCDDEGTMFALPSLNITTGAELHDYLSRTILSGASSEEIDELLKLYPQDATQGSPFDTGEQNAITPQFKRIAAIIGDIEFQAPRRFFLEYS